MRKAVIDRFENTYAVIEWMDTKTTVDVLRSDIPSNAKVGDVLILDGSLWVVDEKATLERKHLVEKMMDGLWEDDES